MPTKRKDNAILADIESELVWDGRVPAADIDVHITNGIVTLKGSVSSLSDPS